MGNLIIDNRPHGLPHAPAYYEMFRQEVSPLGPINFATRLTTLMGADTSLELLLELLLKIPSDSTVVVVCHAYKYGLLMPIVRKGSLNLANDVGFQIIDSGIEKEAEANRIRQLPTSTPAEKNAQLDRWRELCNSMQSGVLTGTFTVAEAESKYAELIEVRAKALEFPIGASKSRTPAFRAFLANVLAVRRQNRQRLELRACNLGSSRDGMDGVRRFFNVQKLVAPNVETFFMSKLKLFVASRPGTQWMPGGRGAKTGAKPGPLGTTAPADLAGIKHQLEKKDDHTRGFVKLTKPGASATAQSDFAVAITINRPEEFTYEGSISVISTGDLATPDWLKIKEFLETSVSPLPVWSSGHFPLAGFWTLPVSPNVPFLLSRDPEYVKHLTVYPPQ